MQDKQANFSKILSCCLSASFFEVLTLYERGNRCNGCAMGLKWSSMRGLCLKPVLQREVSRGKVGQFAQ